MIGDLPIITPRYPDGHNRAGLLRFCDEGLSLFAGSPAALACSRALARANECCQQTRAIPETRKRLGNEKCHLPALQKDHNKTPHPFLL